MSRAATKVFISHSHRDAEVGNAIKNLLLEAFQELKAKEIRLTSRPETGLLVGEVVNRALIEDIKQAPVFISILSHAYLSSTYCIAEYGAKIGTGADPVILYLQGMDPKELPGVFRDRHAVNIKNKHALSAFLEDVADETGWTLSLASSHDQLEALSNSTIEAGDNLTELRARLIPDLPPPFLNAYGLQQHPCQSNLYQDFTCDKAGRNTEPVQFLWADSRRANWIRASLKSGPQGKYLRIEFNHKGGAGCDISIRPQDESALLNNYSNLLIDARVAGGANAMHPIGLGIRLVNGYMQHWRLHDTAEDPKVIPVVSRTFGEPVRIALGGEWGLFCADGTVDRGPPRKSGKPDLSIISSINLSLGAYEAFKRSPGGGKGVLEIREIRFA